MEPDPLKKKNEPKHYRSRELKTSLMPRHLAILRETFNFRVIQLRQLHALLGTHGEVKRTKADTGIARNVRQLLTLGCLALPESPRPTLRLANQRDVYVLTAAGARLLEEYYTQNPLTPDDPETFRGISKKNWSKWLTFTTIDHTLGINDILIAVRLTAERFRFPCRILYYDDRETPEGRKDLRRYATKKEYTDPDGRFTLTIPEKEGAPPTIKVDCYLEFDRAGSVNSEKMRTRYDRYFRWWLAEGGAKGDEKYTRVLTICKRAGRVAFLRNLVKTEGLDHDKRTGEKWRGFFFADFADFDLMHPHKIFGRIYQTPHREDRLPLTHPFVSLP